MELLWFMPYFFIAAWAIFSIVYIIKASNNFEKINPIIFDHIPSVFTTLGVFGTFLGIAFGLHGFDVNNIDASIPELLEGLFVAFWSSIAGIALSLISQTFIQKIQNKALGGGEDPVTEGQILKSIDTSLQEIKKAISSDSDGSITTHLIKMRTSIQDNFTPLNATMLKLAHSVGGDEETSLLTQIQNLRVENKEKQEAMVSIQNEQLEFMKSNTELVKRKFDEFSDLLRESNTEALVEVIENVIGGFNDKLNELIERLVKENFQELNSSVENLNKWQQANKEQVDTLLKQYKSLTDQLTLSADILDNVSNSTQTLVKEDGKLVTLIDELNTITSDGDNIFVKTVEKLEGTSADFKKTSEELKNWFELHTEFSDKIENLVDRLDEIEQLRNKTEGFFDDVKKEFEENRWNAEIDKDLSIRFLNENVLFDYNSVVLKSEFRQILNDFFPRYLEILLSKRFKDKIAEVRIEGHTDSSGPYMFNVNLSQNRTANVLDYLFNRRNSKYEDLPKSKREILRYWFTTTGFSSGRTLDNSGDLTLVSGNAEDSKRSRRVEFKIVTKSEEVVNQMLRMINE